LKYSEAKIGRIFILRLEHGDKIPDVIEEFAAKQKIKSAIVHFLGGADAGSKVVVGPEDGTAPKPRPMVTELSGTSEAVGMGTLFINEAGIPKLHMHAAFGRERGTVTGCTREGVAVWHIGEAVICELLGTSAARRVDPGTGFELLELDFK
jgi:predicted DNA-binding protein with PD1-like motif